MHLKLNFEIDVFMQKVEQLESATAPPNSCALPDWAG